MASWLRTTDFKNDKYSRLMANDCTYTYSLHDIAYHFDKVKRGNDILIDLFGADHHGYIHRFESISSQTFGVDSIV